MKLFFQTLFSSILNFVYPTKCGLCGQINSSPICAMCSADFKPLDSGWNFSPSSSALDYWAAGFRYEGRAAQAVRTLKYQRVTSLVNPLSKLLRSKLNELGYSQIDMIVPIPIHWRKLFSRGFNQSLFLCSEFRDLNVEHKILHRIKFTKSQVGLNQLERMNQLIGCFESELIVKGCSVLLIDDVMTTGGTAEACAKALKMAGAYEVGLLALCGKTEN